MKPQAEPASTAFTILEKVLAMGVHLFTASGLIAAFFAIVAISNNDFRGAMIWLIIAFFIDGIDGTFARMFRVKEVLPQFDGKVIDYVIDFSTYAIIPAFFLFNAETDGNFTLPEQEWVRISCIILILLVSAIYYAKAGMVSDSYEFVGFPVLWNMVAFYMYFVWDFSPWVNAGLILFFAVMHFVPIKYSYPSRKVGLFYPTLIVTALFFILNGLLVYLFPEEPTILIWLSNGAMIYYALVAVYNTFWLGK